MSIAHAFSTGATLSVEFVFSACEQRTVTALFAALQIDITKQKVVLNVALLRQKRIYPFLFFRKFKEFGFLLGLKIKISRVLNSLLEKSA